MSFVCQSYNVICIYSYTIRVSLICPRTLSLCARMSSVCHSYVMLRHSYMHVCHPYITCMYSYVIRISLVCHPYVTRIYSYVIRMLLVCGFTMNLQLDQKSFDDCNICIFKLTVKEK